MNNINYPKPLTFDNFTPKNNKVKCYPYNYLYITNNNGSHNVLKIEDFSGENCSFTEIFSVSVGGSGILVPTSYKGVLMNIDESIQLGKFPTIQWSADSYTNWLTQNGVNEKNSLIRFGMNELGNALSGNLAGMIETGADFVMGKMEKLNEVNLLPEKTAGTSCGDVSFSLQKTDFEIHRMRPRLEYLQQIDDFFTRFGYKVNTLKIPNIATRTYWNYVEIGSNERSAITNPSSSYPVPQSDLDDINDKLRKGLTIWNNAGNIGNYSLDNSIN